MQRIETKNAKNINGQALVVAVDIGKSVHYGYFRAPLGEEVKPFPFANTHKGFQEFWQKLSQFQRQQGLEECVIGFESTGPYAEPLFHYLRSQEAKLVQINPLHTKRLKELTGNSPNKTDRKDPRVIADVISLGHALTLVVPEGAAAELRRLIHARERAMKRRTALFNQLHYLMAVVFPEFLEVMKKISTKTAMYLIKNHPTPQHIVAMGLESLRKVLKKMSCGKITEERARRLFEAAQESIGIREGQQGILIEIRYLISAVEEENGFIADLEKQMFFSLNQIPYSHSILSIKGIGKITAAGLIGEVGDFRKFKTIAEITKLAGLDLYEISSGKHKGQHRISKRGRSLMRKLLYFAVVNMIRSHGLLHKPWQQMVQRGMPTMKAMVALSRKLLRVIFALARDNTIYQENYTQTNTYKLAA
ncbi:MAG: transposase of ISPca8 [Deltaproteobacteria bacterium]|nr:transposase of ISPca8 [Deltaproteobacteria bacterium]